MMTPGAVLVVTPGVVVLTPGVVVLRPGVVVLRPGVVVLRPGVAAPRLGTVEPGSGARLLFGTTGRPGPRISDVEPVVVLPMAPVVWPGAAVESAANGTIHRKRIAAGMRNLLFNEGVAAKAIPPRPAGT
jgi:hypothetical protein